MKIFGFYISRTDWESLWKVERKLHNEERKHSLHLNDTLKKYIKPRDSKGRFISKQDLMTAQLKAEQTPPLG